MNEQEKRRYEEEQNSLVPSDEAMNALFAAAKNAAAGSDEHSAPSRKSPQIAFRRLGVACLSAAMLLLVFCLPLQAILTAPQNGGEQPQTPNSAATSPKKPEVLALKDYGEILKVYNNWRKNNVIELYTDGVMDSNGLPLSGNAGTAGSSTNASDGYFGVEEESSTPNANKNSPHSETNNQVAGVQEGDVVKTDGKYVYSLFTKPETPYPRGLQICTLTDTGDAEKVAFLPLDELFPTVKNPFTYAGCDLYLHDEKLLIIRRSDTEEQTLLTVLSVGETTPKIEAQFTQSGYYTSARLIGDAFYLITDDAVSHNSINEEDPKTFVPSCGALEHESLIPAEDIHVVKPENMFRLRYTVVSSYSLSGEAKMTSSKAVLGNVEYLYASTESLYTLSTRYNGYRAESDILRFSLNEEGVELVAEGSVLGSPLNQFSMQEKDGVFTIVTTYYTQDFVTYNGIYTFDQSLKALGALDGLGKDERVHSVRFDGDLSYFVTYRQTDPVFCVDLSDAASPKLLSALKIPGYSSYLHVWDEDTLFGIGR
ncbi:MAG: beta-propeller domain-containing protein, partial [Clostridia bacterium]|nr:beta-propeller domain-containing protein [Clostridia bacterium]